MQITITDEGTRRVVVYALWSRLHQEFGDGTDAFYDEARAAVEHGRDLEEEIRTAEEAVEFIATTLQDVSVARDADLGESVELSILAEELASEVENCRDYVRESEAFWDAESRQRAVMLETFDAAGSLMGTPMPVGAVA